MVMNTFYVYAHFRDDTSLPFYIGKGHDKRAWSKKGRNLHWRGIVAKLGFSVVILKSNMTEEDALEYEIAIIAKIGREHLCNQTDGGEGSSGYIATEETRRKISIANSNPSAEVRARKSLVQIGHTLSPESRMKLSLSKRNMSDKTKQRIGNGRRGKTHSVGSRQKISSALRGRVITEEWKAKIARANFVPVKTQCGLKFESVKSATDWLRSNGKPKASNSCIVKCCKGGLQHAYGFQWSYVTD